MRRWAVGAIAAAFATAPASADTVRGTAMIGGVEAPVELTTGVGIGEVRYRPGGKTGAWERVSLDTLGPVVAILADTRLAILHEAIDRWAGEDLAALRDAMIERTRLAWERGRAGARAAQPSQGTVRTRVRSLLQYAVALREGGRGAEAIALLRAERDGNTMGSDWERAEWATVSAALAGAMVEQGQRPAAIALLEDAATRLAGSPYAINVILSRAALLAEDGRHAEALAQVEIADAAFRQAAPRGAVVPGAWLQFDWVRACALRGLGRADEAAALMAHFADAEKPVSRRFAPPANSDVETRAWLCLHDPDALVAAWRRDMPRLPAGAMTLVVAQPGYRDPTFDKATIARAQAAIGATPPLRVLPERYRAALDGWR